MALASGTRLGPYNIVALIGVGGMGGGLQSPRRRSLVDIETVCDNMSQAWAAPAD
jgi:hypothetical protein